MIFWPLNMRLVARPKRFELLTPRFVVWCSKAGREGDHEDGLVVGQVAAFVSLAHQLSSNTGVSSIPASCGLGDLGSRSKTRLTASTRSSLGLNGKKIISSISVRVRS